MHLWGWRDGEGDGQPRAGLAGFWEEAPTAHGVLCPTGEVMDPCHCQSSEVPWFEHTQNLGDVHTHPLPPCTEEIPNSGNSAGLCPQHPLFNLLQNPCERKTGKGFFFVLLRQLWKPLLFFH